MHPEKHDDGKHIDDSDGFRYHHQKQKRGGNQRPDLVKEHVKQTDPARGDQIVVEFGEDSAERAFADAHMFFDESKNERRT